MNPIPNTVFGEKFFGYKFDANGMHSGPSLPLLDSSALLVWISNWVEKFPELRICDSGDSVVMHIKDSVVVFPAPNGQTIRWDKDKKELVPATVRRIDKPVRPESFDEFQANITRMSHLACVECKAPFTSLNTKTPAGWRDTQIVGMCETCYDNLFN